MTLTLGLLLAAALVGFGLSFWIARGVANGVKSVQATLTSMSDRCATSLENGLGALAKNDLTVEAIAVTKPIEKYGKDEIGETAEVTNIMLAKLQSTIASYEKARASLTETVGDVKLAAQSVARTATEVSSAATQSGRAAEQIAQTIGQVASGAEDQAKAAASTSSGVQELSAVIDQVGGGASQTARKVEVASKALAEMSTAIASAAAASGEVRDVASAQPRPPKRARTQSRRPSRA